MGKKCKVTWSYTYINDIVIDKGHTRGKIAFYTLTVFVVYLVRHRKYIRTEYLSLR